MTTKLKAAQQTRELAEHKLATVRAEVEAKAMERTLGLLESPQPVQVPWREYPGADDFSRFPNSWDSPYIWSDMEDRQEGRYLPYYRNAQDLRRIRAEGRLFKAKFPVAAGALDTLTNFNIGTGYEFKAQPAKGYEQFAPLAAQIQKKIDGLLKRNDFIGSADRMIHANSREDGEVFAALYPDGRTNREVRLELVNPDYILEPARYQQLERMCGTHGKINGWWHGVHTLFSPTLKRDDVSRPLGYHAVYDHIGDQWDYLPACRVEHIKRNVGTDSRRGINDFYLVAEDLLSEAKLRRNTVVGAAILAAIVLIRQHAEGVTKDSIQKMVADGATSTYQKPVDGGGRTTNIERTQPGTVKDIPFGMEATVGPLGTLRSPVYVEVDQFILRIISVRWQIPEFMISGDASNSNYASTNVTMEPFLRAREADQGEYANHFVSLIWKALRMYYEAGEIPGASWECIREVIDLTADYQTPETRDKLKQAQTDEILSTLEVKSKRSICADYGLDYDEERIEIAKEPKTAPAAPNFGVPPIPGVPPVSASNLRSSMLAVRAIDTLLRESNANP